jgi:hypothetical protein
VQQCRCPSAFRNNSILEESAGIELDDDDIDQINVVGDLIRCVVSAVDKSRPRAA